MSTSPDAARGARNAIFHQAYEALLALHEWDPVDLHMSGDQGLVRAELEEMLSGTRPMTRDEERALGELARAWRKLAG